MCATFCIELYEVAYILCVQFERLTRNIAILLYKVSLQVMHHSNSMYVL